MSNTHATDEQRPPEPERPGRPAIWDLVIEDMRARDQEGRRRYGTPLQAGNGRDALVDAYQEALDLAVYLRQAIEERLSPPARPSPPASETFPSPSAESARVVGGGSEHE